MDSDIAIDQGVQEVEESKNVLISETVPVKETIMSPTDANVGNSSPKEQVVWGVINFTCCQNAKLREQDLKRVEKIMNRYDHLKKNFVKIDFGQYSSNKIDNRFSHSLDMKLLVDVSNLWENARPYVWKFLGQEEWKYDDGMCITFDRIHVKQ